MAFRIIERKGTLRFLLPTPYFRGKQTYIQKMLFYDDRTDW